MALAFEKPLQELGWSLGRDIEIHYRWGAGDTELTRAYAKELIQPDLILANTNTAMAALHREASTVPIVFPSPVSKALFWCLVFRSVVRSMPALLRGADIVQVQGRSNENEMRNRLPSSIAQGNDHATQVSSSRNAFVALRSVVSKPSVNQQKMGASRPRASLRRP